MKTTGDKADKADKLLDRKLELVDKVLETRQALDQSMKEGFFALARARYADGASVRSIRLPSVIRARAMLDVAPDAADMSLVSRSSVSDDSAEDTREQDPLRWFGVLVPPTLRQSQAHFQAALAHCVNIAVMQSQLVQADKAFLEEQLSQLSLSPRAPSTASSPSSPSSSPSSPSSPSSSHAEQESAS